MKVTPINVINYCLHLGNVERPVKHTLALLLQATRISRYMIVDRTYYRIRFATHSALARSFWVSPKGRQREEHFVISYLTEGDTVVDVGANIGSITFAAASRVGPLGRVISIEPHPRTFRYLLDNDVLNQFDNIQFYNSAIGSSLGVVHFTDRGDDDQNRVIEAGGIPVEVTTLDDLLSKTSIPAVDLLKVDVEGYEKQVLEGAARTLQNTKCVYIETLERNLKMYGTSTAEILQLLRASGFQVYRVDGKSEEAVAIRDMDEFISRVDGMNLVAVV